MAVADFFSPLTCFWFGAVICFISFGAYAKTRFKYYVNERYDKKLEEELTSVTRGEFETYEETLARVMKQDPMAPWHYLLVIFSMFVDYAKWNNEFLGLVVPFFLVGGLQLGFYTTIYVFLGCLIAKYLHVLVQNCRAFYSRPHLEDPRGRYNFYQNQKTKIKLTSAYENFSVDLYGKLKIFVPQMLVMWFYISTLSRRLEMTNHQITYAIGGILFVPLFVAKATSHARADPDREYFSWEAMFLFSTQPETAKIAVYENGAIRYPAHAIAHAINREEKHAYFKLRRYDLHLRFVMDLIVNSICVDVLSISLPLFLAHSGSNLSFVTSAVSMLFVIALDDINGFECAPVPDDATAADDDKPGRPPHPLSV